MKKNKIRLKAVKAIVIVEVVILLCTAILSSVYCKYACETKKRELENIVKKYAEWIKEWYGEEWFNKPYYRNAETGDRFVADFTYYYFDSISYALESSYQGDKGSCPFGMEFELFDKNGTKLSDGEKEYLSLAFDSKAYSLRHFFTEKQIKDAVLELYGQYDPEKINVEKIVGYYENDSFVICGLTLYKVSDDYVLNEYEIVNEELLKKAPTETEVIYNFSYFQYSKYNTTNIEGDPKDTVFWVSDSMDYIKEQRDNWLNHYDREVLKISQKYYDEKALNMETGQEVSLEYINEDDNIIGVYGVIDYSKSHPELEWASTARFSMCLDVQKYLKAEMCSNDFLFKHLITFIILQVLGIMGLLAVRSRNSQIKKSKEARNVLINAMAHEMKTPAEIITTSLQKIKETSDETVIEQGEKIICDEAEHISDLVSHMLTYTRKSDYGYELKTEMTDISAIVENTCERLELITAKRNIIIEVEERFRCVLDADSKLIAIAVDNLITNAIALCRVGGKIVITTNLHGIDVSYEGRKLNANERRNIWKPFKDMNAEISGLYVSGEIFELHNYDYGSVPTEDGMNLFFKIKS